MKANQNYTLENTYHDTTATFRWSRGFGSALEAYLDLEAQANRDFYNGSNAQKIRRIKNKLCCGDDCQCWGMVQSA